MSNWRTQYHEEGDQMAISYWQDCEPHLEHAAALRREDREAGKFRTRSADFRRTMTVPTTVVMKIANEHKLDFFNPEHAKRILQILKGPDYAAFRTTNDILI